MIREHAQRQLVTLPRGEHGVGRRREIRFDESKEDPAVISLFEDASTVGFGLVHVAHFVRNEGQRLQKPAHFRQHDLRQKKAGNRRRVPRRVRHRGSPTRSACRSGRKVPGILSVPRCCAVVVRRRVPRGTRPGRAVGRRRRRGVRVACEPRGFRFFVPRRAGGGR